MSDQDDPVKIAERVRTLVGTLRRLRSSTDPFELEHLTRVDSLLDMNLDLLDAAVRRVSE